MAVYRGVLLYGESGAGKSSLINAGLLPQIGALGLTPERVRVQPRENEEFVIERIAADDETGDRLPSALTPAGETSSRVVLSIDGFQQRVRSACEDHRLLIIFDQYEEILTLFEEAREPVLQRRIVEVLDRLLREPLQVKLLFGFREDYLGRVKDLMYMRPELVDQSLRLVPPTADALPAIIRGPFERYPDHFGNELSPGLAHRLQAALAERFGTGDVSLSEVQTVCLRLWQSSDPEALLTSRGLQGLLEDYLGEALDALPADLRVPAIALLGQMVTAAGTRNVISAGDLVERVRAEDRDLPAPLLQAALERLESESRLVRRERRRDLYLYEITSEFIVPWISRRRDDLRRQHERRRDRRRLMWLGLAVLVLVAFGAVVTVLAIDANRAKNKANAEAARAEDKSDEAERQANEAASLGLAMAAVDQRTTAPAASMLFSLAAFERSQRPETRKVLLSAVGRARQSGVQAVLHDHADAVYAVGVSPDGRTIASGGKDGTVLLWDRHTHRRLAQLGRLPEGINAVTFSHDGDLLAAVDLTGTTRVWDMRDRRLLGVAFKGDPDNYAATVAFTPDGRQLVAYQQGKGILRWDVQRRSAVAAVSGQRRPPGASTVAFSPDARLLAVGTYGRGVTLWDVRSGERIRGALPVPGHFAYAVAFSPDSHTVAAAGRGSRIALMDVRTRKVRHLRSKRGQDNVFALAFSPNGRTLVAGGSGKTITWWSLGDRRSRAMPQRVHGGSVLSLAFAGDNAVASASADDTVVISSLRDARRYGGAIRNTRGAEALSPTLAAAAQSRRIRLVALPSGRLLRPLRTDDRGTYDLVLSANGRTLIGTRVNGSIRVWDVRRRKVIAPALRPDRHRRRGPVYFLDARLSRDGSRLAISGNTGVIRLWNLPKVTALPPLDTGLRHVTALALSDDGTTVAVVGGDNKLRLWDVEARRQVGPALGTTVNGVSDVEFTRDGRSLATLGPDGSITLWSVEPLRRRGALTEDVPNGYNVIFTPDGATIAAATYDGEIRLFDVNTRRPLTTLRGTDSRGYLGDIAFSRDGSSLMMLGGLRSEVHLWDHILWRSRREVEQEICGRTGTGLSETEWGRYAPDIPFRPICP